VRNYRLETILTQQRDTTVYTILNYVQFTILTLVTETKLSMSPIEASYFAKFPVSSKVLPGASNTIFSQCNSEQSKCRQS